MNIENDSDSGMESNMENENSEMENKDDNSESETETMYILFHNFKTANICKLQITNNTLDQP